MCLFERMKKNNGYKCMCDILNCISRIFFLNCFFHSLTCIFFTLLFLCTFQSFARHSCNHIDEERFYSPLTPPINFEASGTWKKIEYWWLEHVRIHLWSKESTNVDDGYHAIDCCISEVESWMLRGLSMTPNKQRKEAYLFLKSL
jgi:hypothetical protein